MHVTETWKATRNCDKATGPCGAGRTVHTHTYTYTPL